MKKVLITESQLRGMVRKMIMEQTPLGSVVVGNSGFAPQATQQSSLTTNASKQSTTLNAGKNKALTTTLSQVDTKQELLGQFMNTLNNVNQKLKPGVVTKQTLLTDFGRLLTDLGYK